MGISAGGDLTADAKSVILPIFKRIESLEYKINNEGFSESSPFPELQLIGELSQVYTNLEKAISDYRNVFEKSEIKEYNKLYGKAMKFLDKSTKRPRKNVVHVMDGCDPFVSEFRQKNFDKYTELSADIKSKIRNRVGIEYEETDVPKEVREELDDERYEEHDDFESVHEPSVELESLKNYTAILSRKLEGDYVKSGDIKSLMGTILKEASKSDLPDDVYKPINDASNFLEEYVTDPEDLLPRGDSSWLMFKKVSGKLNDHFGNI